MRFVKSEKSARSISSDRLSARPASSHQSTSSSVKGAASEASTQGTPSSQASFSARSRVLDAAVTTAATPEGAEAYWRRLNKRPLRSNHNRCICGVMVHRHPLSHPHPGFVPSPPRANISQVPPMRPRQQKRAGLLAPPATLYFGIALSQPRRYMRCSCRACWGPLGHVHGIYRTSPGKLWASALAPSAIVPR